MNIETKRKTRMWIAQGEDILFELLLYLPVYLLVRLRLVCKQWRDIIDNPVFAAAHLRRRTDEYSFIFYKEHPLIMKTELDCNLYMGRKGTPESPVVVKVKGESAFHQQMMFPIGSADYKYIWSTVWVLDPLSHRLAADADALIVVSGNRMFYGYGIGLHESTGEYKLVCLFAEATAWNTNTYTFGAEVRVLGTNKCKQLNTHFPSLYYKFLPLWGESVWVGGAIYWLVGSRIILFDLEKEEFGEMDISNRVVGMGMRPGCFYLVNLGGLAIADHSVPRMGIRILEWDVDWAVTLCISNNIFNEDLFVLGLCGVVRAEILLGTRRHMNLACNQIGRECEYFSFIIDYHPDREDCRLMKLQNRRILPSDSAFLTIPLTTERHQPLTSVIDSFLFSFIS